MTNTDLVLTRIMFTVIKLSMAGQIDGNLTVDGIYPTRKLANKRKDRLQRYTSFSKYYVRRTRVFEPRKDGD